MASTKGLVRGLVAAALLATVASPAIGLMMALPAGQIVARQTDAAGQTTDDSMFDLAAAKAGWLDEFERFAGRHPSPAPDTSDKNVVVVAKAVPGFEAPSTGPLPESVEPKDAPKPVAPALAPAAADDPLLKTGSIKSQAVPLLPPVPGPEAFTVHKGDRLGGPQRIDPSHTAPSATDPSAAPHAELGPTKANAAALAPGKSAMLLPARSDKLKPMVVASAAMKPLDLAPERPDAVFQGPPMPADPTIDPDAPVLGYAAQMSTAEAPFKALFAVSPIAKRSWLSTNASAAPTASTKPSKMAHLPHRHNRKHDG